jgi:serine/threonine protein kinase/WD40 repeat protein/regulation of enolase protein 1 (concanavalin A-like superfamily)
MTTQRTDKERIFTAALELSDPAQRKAFLDAACGQNRELLAQVEALLKHDEEAGSFIEEPVVARGAAPAGALSQGTVDFRPVTEGPGTVIGPYKLLQKIGEGGFGVVYMAEQQHPVRRKVALKIIKPGMDTREVIARFESERQALALMDHPNIARVLDAGATASGRPYFVMELVKGVPITEYCDKNNLSTEKRLELFLAVCHAVQHAHQKGIIHRDIKPSNVMVTLHDGKPVPKVIDFGVAKATSQQLTEKTLFTAYGQMIGTPVYMSPEQAEMSGLDIDTRSDIYSLGVLLYELLTGTTPFDSKRLRDAGYVEMQRIIREEEPPRPSTRVSTLGQSLTVVSSQRSTDPGKLRQLLRGDLDLIVMKAMEKERTLRYETPNSFAQDLERFLNHQEVLARPHSTAYQLRKFAQRNKTAVAWGTAIAATLLLGTIVSTVLAFQANHQKNRAQANLFALHKQQVQTDEERRKAVSEAERAKKAESLAAEQKTLADKRAKEAEESRAAEAQLRQAAVEKSQAIEQQKNQIEGLNTQLRRSMEDQRRSIYAAEMNLVRLEAQRGNLARLRELLMQQLPGADQEDLRGWEWTYWYRFLTRADKLYRYEGFVYGKPDSALTLAPGGKLAALTRGDKTDWIELPSGKPAGSIPQQLRIGVNRSSLSRNGRMATTSVVSQSAYWPRTNEPPPPAEIAVWEPNGEKLVFAIPEKTLKHLSFVQLSEDGSLLAAIGNDTAHERDKPACRLLAWSVDDRKLLLNQSYPGELNRLALSVDGTHVVAYLCHGTKRHNDDPRDVAALVETATGAVLGRARHNDDVDSAFLLPDTKRVLLATLGFSGANRKELLLWSVGDETPRKLTSEHMPDYVKGAVNPEGTLFAVSGFTVSTIRLIDTQRGTLLSTLHNEATTIEALTFSPDGKQLLAASTTGEVLRWDLDQDEDLFRLRARPLGQLATPTSYALSPDRTRLALINLQRQLLLRTAGGDETLLGERDPQAQANASVGLVFSADSRYLAYVAGNVVQLFDVVQRKQLWRLALRLPAGASDSLLTAPISPIAFSPDSQEILLSNTGETFLLECATGKARPDRPAPRRVLDLWADDLGRWLALASERIMGKTQLVVSDVFTGERLGAFSPGSARGPTMFVGAPDGRHFALARTANSLVEIWDFVEDRRVLAVPGDTIEFSPDGALAAVATSAPLTLAALGSTGGARRRELTGIGLWEVATGAQVASISLAGNRADEVRFSPDGQRLLTLHGKQALGAGGAIPEVRLWDVRSGREILAIPVAEVNHYIWDVYYDSAGSRLTLLVMTKASGTSGGWGATVFDATPLSEDEDAALVARRRVDDLLARCPLPALAVEAIEADQRLKPSARNAAIALAQRQPVDLEALVAFCQESIANTDLPPERYQAALRCAQALAQAEPGKLRSHVLLGGTQLRAGLVNEAHQTLTVTADPATNSQSSDSEYDYCRNLLVVLAEHRLGKTVKASDRGHLGPYRPPTASTESTSASAWTFRLFMEGRQIAPERFFSPVTTTREVPEALLRSMFERADSNADQRIDPAEVEQLPNLIRKHLAQYDANADGHFSPDEFIAGMRDRFESSRLGPSRREAPARFDYDQQLREDAEKLARTPEDPHLLNNRAWLLAAFPDDAQRNGKEAVDLAKKACDLTAWKNAGYIDTLAAAHAEAGDFDAAVKYEEQALTLAPEALRAEFSHRLALYSQSKPYRLPGQYRTIADWGRSVDPLGDCEVIADPDTLRIKIPGGEHNMSPYAKGTNAPRVVREVEGDFTVEVKVTCPIDPKTILPGASTTYQAAGLLVAADGWHFLRVERNGFFRDWDQEPSFGKTGRTSLSSNAPTIEYWTNRKIVAQHVDWSGTQPQLPGDSTWLRVERRGNALRTSISHDGQKWEEKQTIETKLPSRVQVGVLAVNSSGDEFQAEFSHFKLTQP